MDLLVEPDPDTPAGLRFFSSPDVGFMGGRHRHVGQYRNGMIEGSASSETADEVLFTRLAAGDAEAFASFYDRHASLWYSLALRILQDPNEAEDVLQEAAVLVWERARQYDPTLGHPGSWAVTLVRNRAIDRLRAKRRRGDLAERAAEEMIRDEAVGNPAASVGTVSDTASIVRRTLGQLPKEQRRAIELAFFSGLTQSEIAEKLAEPLGTIKARIRRGMITMRDALEGAL